VKAANDATKPMCADDSVYSDSTVKLSQLFRNIPEICFLFPQRRRLLLMIFY